MVERGQGGTPAHTFPKGSCVKFEVTPPVVKDLVCQTDCCEAACEPVSSTGATLPAGKVGVTYEGFVVFAGSTPMKISVGPVPSWMSVAIGPNYARLFGRPNVAGISVIAVSASNDGSPAVVVMPSVEVTV